MKSNKNPIERFRISTCHDVFGQSYNFLIVDYDGTAYTKNHKYPAFLYNLTLNKHFSFFVVLQLMVLRVSLTTAIYCISRHLIENVTNLTLISVRFLNNLVVHVGQINLT